METTPAATVESNKEQNTSVQNEDMISDKPPDYDGPYVVGTAPPYTPPTLPLPPYQEHLAPPPPYVPVFDDVDLNGREIEDPTARNVGNYHRLSPGTRRLLSINLKFTIVVLAFCISAMGIAIAMVIIGGMNLLKCARMEVPIYLIVGGVLLLAELLIRVSFFVAAHHNRANTHVLNKARKMDFVLCLLFLWVCVGTVWVFRYSHIVCTDMAGDMIFNMTTSATTPMVPCKDCSDKVYIFAFGSMLLQYLFVLFLGVTFCRTILRRDT